MKYLTDRTGRRLEVEPDALRPQIMNVWADGRLVGTNHKDRDPGTTDKDKLAHLSADMEAMRTGAARHIQDALNLVTEGSVALERGKPHVTQDRIDHASELLLRALAKLS